MKRAFQTADAAVQADAVLALLVNLQGEIDQSIFFVELLVGGVGIVRLQLFEVAQLVQAQKAELPKPRVVDLSFFEGDFAANDFVARGRVALELDAANVELLAFVDVDVEEDQLLLVVELGIGNRREVDVAVLAVGFAKVLQALADFFAAEDVAVFDREQGTQRLACW